jgi:hypothetical protein
MNNSDRPQDDHPQGEMPTDDEFLSAYLDNQLSESDRLALDGRLQQEPALREMLTELTTLSQMLKKLPRKSLPPQFSAGVLKRAERQMLLGQNDPQGESFAGQPTVTAKHARNIRWVWWVPTALAAFLAGVLLIPSFVRPPDLAKIDNRSPPASAKASTDKIAKLESKGLQSKELPSKEKALPQRSDSYRVAPDPAQTLGDLATMNRIAMAPDMEKAVLESDKDLLGDPELSAAISDGNDKLAMRLSERDADDVPRFRTAGRESRVEGAANEFQAVPQDAFAADLSIPLIEVQLPVAVLGQAAEDARSRQLNGRQVGGRAGGKVARAKLPNADLGQLLAVEGPTTALSKMISDFKRQGAIVQDFDVPTELQEQLVRQQAQRRRGRSETVSPAQTKRVAQLTDTNASPTGIELREVPNVESLQQLLSIPELQITVLEPNDAGALARLTEQHLRRNERRRQSPVWLQQALLTDMSPARDRPTEPDMADEEASRTELSSTDNDRKRRNKMPGRILSEGEEGRPAETPAPQRAQLYLWLRRQPVPQVD